MEFDSQHRKGVKNRGVCCVKSCDSKVCKNMNLSFHKIPAFGKCKVSRINIFGKEEFVDKRTQWLKLLNIKDKKYLIVCSKHFTKEDYLYPGKVMLTYICFLRFLSLVFFNFHVR